MGGKPAGVLVCPEPGGFAAMCLDCYGSDGGALLLTDGPVSNATAEQAAAQHQGEHRNAPIAAPPGVAFLGCPTCGCRTHGKGRV